MGGDFLAGVGVPDDNHRIRGFEEDRTDGSPAEGWTKSLTSKMRWGAVMGGSPGSAMHNDLNHV